MFEDIHEELEEAYQEVLILYAYYVELLSKRVKGELKDDEKLKKAVEALLKAIAAVRARRDKAQKALGKEYDPKDKTVQKIWRLLGSIATQLESIEDHLDEWDEE